VVALPDGLNFEAEGWRRWRRAGAFLLWAAVGVEVLVLATWTPDTLRVWFDPETHGYGDFPAFYRSARDLTLNAFYSPGLALLLHPLTYFGMRAAFTVYFGLNLAALLGIAWLAQRGVVSLPAKLAVALGVLALPQTHWALRVGHFTEVLAFALLAGLLVAPRRPVLGGALIAVLALKPQYLLVPLLFLAWTRNWRALGAAVGVPALLGAAGVAAMALRDPSGAGMFVYTAQYYVEKLPQAAEFLSVGQRDQWYPQAWQYSWYGFLVSAGIDRNPLIAGELIALSAAVTLLAWKRCSASVGAAAAVLGMLLVTPHTSFYNWSMLAVAAALLLRSDVRPRALAGVLIAMGALAAAASQRATPFPLPYDVYRPAATYGLYWIQPFALAAIAVLALVGRPLTAGEAASEPGAPRSIFRLGAPAPRIALASGGAAIAAVVLGAFIAARVTGAGPFHSDANFSREVVLRALPPDFPAPDAARVRDAGRGERYPYRVEWRSDEPVSRVAGVMRERLDDGSWQIVERHADGAVVLLTAGREQSPDAPPLVAEVRIEPAGGGTVLRVEFSPIPPSSVPGYRDWLGDIGIITHNIDPDSPEARVTPTR
jgi:hypothetical protein